MRKYINKVGDNLLPAKGKADFLVVHANATEILAPIKFTNNLVCVVDNGPFEAAAYAYSENEMEEFKYPDGRPKRWLTVPDAENLAQ